MDRDEDKEPGAYDSLREQKRELQEEQRKFEASTKRLEQERKQLEVGLRAATSDVT